MTTTGRPPCADPDNCWMQIVRALKAERDLVMSMLKQTQDFYDVALAVGGYLDELVPTNADQRLVVEDVARQWRRLTPQQQAGYKKDDDCGPVAEFAWMYVEALSDEAFAERQPAEYGPMIAVEVKEAWWRQHIAALRNLAEGQQIEFQYVLMDLGDMGIFRAATGQERQRFNLADDVGVLELVRPSGEVEIYGCRTWEFRKRLHYQATPRGALLFSPGLDLP